MDDKCSEFVANAWKKDLCVNCQRHETEHKPPTEDVSKPTVPIKLADNNKQVCALGFH